MKLTRREILVTVLVGAGSLGVGSSCSKPCAPIPCPAPGFDPNTCECSKPQTGEAGASAGGATCTAPTANVCPNNLTVYAAQRVDLAAGCFLPEEPVSCDGPVAAEVNACWVKLESGDIYIQSTLPCMPDGWRSCTQDEKDSIANVVTNCK